VVENREVRRDSLHLACEGPCYRDDGVAGDFLATIPQQTIMHGLRRFMHESLVPACGIEFGIDTGSRTEIEHVHSRGQEIQRHLLKSVARLQVSPRGQHEFVVLLSGMHAVNCLAMGKPVSKVAIVIAAGRRKGCSVPAHDDIEPPGLPEPVRFGSVRIGWVCDAELVVAGAGSFSPMPFSPKMLQRPIDSADFHHARRQHGSVDWQTPDQVYFNQPLRLPKAA